MSVARMSGPQLLDAALRTTEQAVDVETIGVGRHLRRDPGDQAHKRLGKRPVHTEDALEGREAHLHLLADRWTPIGLFSRQQDAALGQLSLKLSLKLGAVVGQIPQE